MSGEKVRGSVLLGYFKFIERTWGEGGVVSASSYAGIDRKSINESVWYDLAYSSKLLGWIGKNKGPAYVERCGNWTMKDLGLLSYIVGFMDIKTVLKKGPGNYRDAFSYGRMEVIFGEREAFVRMHDVATHEFTCLSWLGGFKGALEVTKTKGSVVEEKCQRKGAPYCEYHMKW